MNASHPPYVLCQDHFCFAIALAPENVERIVIVVIS